MRRLTLVLLMLLLSSNITIADEGMWTLDNFPRDQVEAKYGVEIDDAWLEKVQLATTRIEGGCTGSFVSPEGLVLTNHHCARRCISQISTAEMNAEEDGFLARNRGEEVQCQGEQLSVLVDSEDITEKIDSAIAGKTEKEAGEIRRRTLTQLEQACEEAAAASGAGKVSCESVSLYLGGQYFLYKYKRYDDVRLVFAPEAGIAAFGGDPDNFNFPRWCLDMSLLRAYEDGEPAATPNYLRWRPEGAKAGEPVFISGHPGSTERLLTVAELEQLRDIVLPSWLLRYSELRGRLAQFAKTGDEPNRIAQAPLLGIENGIKVRRNELRSLLNNELLEKKRADERTLREAVAAEDSLGAEYEQAWDQIAEALAHYQSFRDPYLFLERRAAFNGSLFAYARTLVRAGAERQKSNENRLREYTEAALPGLQQRTLADRPIYSDLETLQLSFSLDKMREYLGPDDPNVHLVLGKDSPDSLAGTLVSSTKLSDPAYRKMLWEGGWSAIEKSDDLMILLAREVDAISRDLRTRYEDEVEAIVDTASERIARARFLIQGTSTYPDATFTLRMTYGSIQGWMGKGSEVEPFTTLDVLFKRATGKDPFRIPQSWIEAKSQLDLSTRFNFVATTDITGGNSGSPFIDSEGRLVGLAFDGNIHSISGAYWFDAQTNRTVGVHPAIMLEALESVYGADHLVGELSTD